MHNHLGLHGLMPVRLRLFLEEHRRKTDAQMKAGRWLGSIGLTPRERVIAQLILDHHSYKDIGRRCRVSPRTVQFHATNIFRKARVAHRRDFERTAALGGPAPLGHSADQAAGKGVLSVAAGRQGAPSSKGEASLGMGNLPALPRAADVRPAQRQR
ncbi:helix-turn-helix transcriptional regulator [Adlercreutzia sp. R21]|uniref:helix-turn-helix domain-containing protein n=1 Tax=Adlercreutzia wanghongyangiae TaxID=3111451 RepID=UPI002DBBD470|nr:helix-turn-helix transcriptional regulator [Adlercreutzia sp. R21]MEC4184779.1 helix-turn-helix transcriptional regulator [Adlercreutzia sp. R21]